MKLSKREHNPYGLHEHELKALAAAEQSPCLKYKRRRRKDLSHAELMDIVYESKQKFSHDRDIARKHRISEILVSRVVNDALKRPEKIEQIRQKEEREDETHEAMHSVLEKLTRERKVILNVGSVVKELEESQ